MLVLEEETIPFARTNSLCKPRKVKFIGSVHALTSRPENNINILFIMKGYY